LIILEKMSDIVDRLKAFIPFDLEDAATLNFSDYDPSMDNASPYRIAEGHSALLGIQSLLIANIWKQKTGIKQVINIDLKRAMEMLDRVNYLQINGRDLQLDAFKRPTSMTNKVSDGHIETTTTLIHLHEGVLDVLDTCPNKEKVREAFLKWKVIDLEEKLNEAEIGGTKVRTQEEFRNHPAGKHLLENNHPFKVTKMNDSPPMPWKPSDRPLSGIKIVDMTLIIAGPLIGNVLAEQGADVLHISNPNAERIPSNFLDTGFGKRCAALDLNQKEDLTRLHSLLKEADVFINGYAPGRLAEKFGLTYEKLMELNPNLIMVSESAFGEDGPWGRRKGWENIAQAATGSLADHGSIDDPQYCPYGFLTDFGTGLFGAIATLVALEQRARLGGAYHVQVTLSNTALWYQDQGSKEHYVYDPDRVRKLIRFTGSGGHRSSYMMKTPTSYGVITHMQPVAEFSHTKPYWVHPTPILGADLPTFVS